MGRRLRRPPFTREFIDRNGTPRNYFRRPGYKEVALPGMPWSPEYMAAYEAAMKGDPLPKGAIGANRTLPGTINAAVVGFYASSAFQGLRPSTKATYRGILENFRVEHGDKRVAMLERKHVDAIVAKKASTPAAANNLLRMLRMLMDYAITQDMRPDNPTFGVKPIKIASDGFHSWTEEEIATFEAKHPIGTRARLALGLLLFTAQRRGDVVLMGRQHIRDGVLSMKQQKTGSEIDIPIHPELQTIIEATPNDHLTFLTTDFGKPFSPAGFGNWFREMCDAAGLKGCSSHGLRKAAARRLAERGATAHEIMAITGHQTLKEVDRYTKAASRKQNAKAAMKKVTA